ncbi:xanthine dehydrogenase family protein molybdopterin-binding subunit [Paraburkholderia tagetis]|uniref:Molybdopterin-dependent oxidoreductase n=1 Tax=Paraburkholderia tagetis TaxID=2913261 RepID=A0A9X1RQE5_9BURK|nr:molybdopterin cofactor-binding domain-containing protein [Paraburkholderia tagetis]MCG5075463.1 molybdopterin-dependent oxidoreductase [Paraburkholderia tagetis]
MKRRAFLKSGGYLLVAAALPTAALTVAQQLQTPAAEHPASPALDQVSSFIAIDRNGGVTAFCGHVDLGTGIRTALAQIVAEELDVPVNRVTMILGDTARTPDQGPTIASSSIQISAVPMRRAAAQARQFLVNEAASRLAVSADTLSVAEGIVKAKNGRAISYGDLVDGQQFHLKISDQAPLKPRKDYRVVGQSVARVDIPAKVTGGLTYVHDMRVPGMLHGRVIRPPYTGMDNTAPIGQSLVSVDAHSIAHIPGIVKIVTIGDFVGVVAEREEHAIRAMHELKVTWKSWAQLPDLSAQLETSLRNNPSTPRTLKTTGNVHDAIAHAAHRLRATYHWPYQMHGSIGPSCAVADFRDNHVTVWSGSQNPHDLRGDLVKLLKLPADQVHVIRMEAAGCYGRNCADDVCADAALLARAVGKPVRVQLMREQEHGWEPKGAAQLIDVDGGLDAQGEVVGYDFSTRYPSNDALTLALLLTGVVPATPAPVEQMGDRTAIPPYRYATTQVVVHDTPPIVRASWMRGVSALPNVFAHESYIDELAVLANQDPVAFRLRYLPDARARELVQAVAKRAGWKPRQPHDAAPKPWSGNKTGVLTGRGFAYARYFHSPFPGFGAAWAAWVVDVEVDPATGVVRVKRVVVGHDCGMMINPDGVRHQVHGNVLQIVSRTLKEEVAFDRSGVTSLEWGAYPILRFTDMPEIDVLLMDRPDEMPLGAGESASVPGAAAIANAIFDATGVRLREVPFTPDRVKTALNEAAHASGAQGASA